jgi:Leucine-rich repeat (LRR) protein
MGSADPGDEVIEPPRRSEGQIEESSLSGSDSVAVARMPITTEHADSSSGCTVGAKALGGDKLVARHGTEFSSGAQDLQYISVPETTLRRCTTSQYAAITPGLVPGRRQQSLPGAERIEGPRPDFPSRDSNARFGGDVIGPVEQSLQQGMPFVQAHVVHETDFSSRGPLVVANLIDDEASLAGRMLVKKNTRKMEITITCLFLLVVGLAIGLGYSGKSDATKENSMITAFVKMLPDLVGPTSQSELSNPTSAQSQARAWIESLPIHNTMTMDRLKQRYALAVLFYSTGDQMWCNRDKWLTTYDECTWFSSSDRPACSEGGYYINLDLKNNCLRNTIPEDIQLLSTLLTLDLSGNMLTMGHFPEPILSLTALSALSLQSASISGTIPGRLKDLTNLESLDISLNYFTGGIQNVTIMTSLKVFDCSSNQLTGPIPTEIGHLTRLVKWSGSGNFFQSFPLSGEGRARKLGTIEQRRDVVISGMPSEFGKLSNLRHLDLSSSNIIGKIPSEVGLLLKLESLDLGFNMFSGTIPGEIFAMSSLEYLDLSENRLTGSLPPNVHRMDSLLVFLLGSNLLGGALPTQIGNLTSLWKLALSNNRITGTIPSELGNLDQLLVLDLAKNKFMDFIPTEIGNLVAMSEVYLNSNSISGTIPTEFGNLWNLSFASLDNTNLIAPIPSELGLLRNLSLVTLYNNSIVGTIPTEICQTDIVIMVQADCDLISGSCDCCTDINGMPCDV